MKKSTYIIGIASANLMLFGSLAKVMHWPGASILLILSVFLFCFIFLPVALFNSYLEGQKNYMWLHLVTFIVFFIGMMGVLFKVQHWPGVHILMFIGIPLPFVLFLPVYLYQTRKQKKNGTGNLLGVVFGLTFLAVFSVLLALNVGKGQLWQIARTITNNENSTAMSELNLENHSGKSEIKNQSDALCTYINELKCELLLSDQNGLYEGNRVKSTSYSFQINSPDNPDNSRYILFEMGKNRIQELKEKIKEYHALLTGSGQMNPDLTELSNSLFDLNAKSEIGGNEENLTWEDQQFRGYQLIFVLDVLSEIESNVRLVESELLASTQ